MNRRGFLAALLPAAAALVLPELLVPRRSFFLPPATGWPAGVEGLTAEKVRLAKKYLQQAEYIDRDDLPIANGVIGRYSGFEWRTAWDAGVGALDSPAAIANKSMAAALESFLT